MSLSIEFIKNVTGFSNDQRASLMSYLGNLPEVMMIDIHRNHHVVIKQMKQHFSNEMASEFHYSTFLMTIEKMKKLEGSPTIKAKLTDKEQSVIDYYKLARINSDPPKRRSVKRDKIFIQYRPLIYNFREQGLSWSKISEYLKRHHKLKISPAYIQRLFTPPLSDHKKTDDSDYIRTLTNMAHTQRKRLVTVYCRFSETDRINVHTKKVKIAHENKLLCVNENKAEFHHACFILAIDHFFFEKLKENNEHRIDKNRLADINKSNKRLIKNKIDDQHIDEIFKMRLNGVSWRKISDHFQSQHTIPVSHTSLKKLYDDIIIQKET